MTDAENLTVEILKQIRDEIATTRTELGGRIDDGLAAVRSELGARIDTTNERLGVVETTLQELATQQRFVVRHLVTLTDRDHRLEADVADLRSRVEVLEKQITSR